MTLFNETKSESSHANLGDGSVIQDLTSDVLQVNYLTNVSLQQEILGMMESLVNTVVVHLEQGSLKLHFACSVIVNQGDEILNDLLTVLYDVSLVGIAVGHLRHLGVQLIILVMEMVKLDNADSSHLGEVVEILEI